MQAVCKAREKFSARQIQEFMASVGHLFVEFRSAQSTYRNSAELSIVWQKSDSAFHSAVDFMGASFFSFFRCVIHCLVKASISLVASLTSCPVGGRARARR